MTDRNVRLVIIAVAMLAVGVLLFVMTRSSRRPSSDDQAGAGTAGTAGVPGRAPAGSVTVAPRGPSAVADTAAAEAAVDPSGDAGVERETRTYVMDDGTVVRDHRRGDAPPPVATSPVPPGQRTMSSAITASVYAQITPQVAACASQVPAAARGAEPFVYVNLTVQVAGGALTTTDVTPVAHDVDESAAGALVACVRDGLSTLRVEAAGEPDQASYVLQYPIRLR